MKVGPCAGPCAGPCDGPCVSSSEGLVLFEGIVGCASTGLVIDALVFGGLGC